MNRKLKFLTNNQFEWTNKEFFLFATHVICKDFNLVRVACGKPWDPEKREFRKDLAEEHYYSVFIVEDDYDKIDHDKPYVFIHQPDPLLTRPQIINFAEECWKRCEEPN